MRLLGVNYDMPTYRKYVLGVLFVTYATNFIDRYILIILQEPIRAEFGLSDTQLGLMTGFAFALFYGTMGLPIARLADRFNRRNIMAVCIVIWSAMTALSGLARSYSHILAARIGVGIGEAGGTPPAHSMISDIYPPQSRATALAIYTTALNVGIFGGYMVGGWINEFFGWRMAFMIVGVPGLLIAALLRFTVKEPERGYADGHVPTEDAPSVPALMQRLWKLRSFRYIALGGALQSLGGYGIDTWFSPYLIRNFELGTGEVGTWLGLLTIPGALGILLGGRVCDRLRPRDVRWSLWVPALAGLLAAPFSVAVFLMPNAALALAVYVVPLAMFNIFLASSIATAHELVPQRARALASAILLMVFNLVGLGLGPLSIGMGSDALHPVLDDEALRIILIAAALLFNLGAAAVYMLAARSLPTDLADSGRDERGASACLSGSLHGRQEG